MKRLQETKLDVGKQMHEMCSMVEEIAGMTKKFEFQINAKRPDVENLSHNI